MNPRQSQDNANSSFVKRFSNLRKEVENDPEILKKFDQNVFINFLRSTYHDPGSPSFQKVIGIVEEFKTNFNSLELALVRGNLQLAETLLKNGAKLDGPEWDEIKPAEIVFWKINMNVRKEMLLLLLKYGLDVSLKTYGNNRNLLHSRRNLLHLFTLKAGKDDAGAPEIAKILIESGIPVDQADNFDITPLFIAVDNANIELVKFFIQNGANVKHRDSDRHIPLNRAAEGPCTEIVDLLLLNGAGINTKDAFGKTALHYACENHRIKTINLLLHKGADLRVEDQNGKTPYLSLKPGIRDYDAGAILMIKEISKLIFNTDAVSVKDTKAIEADQRTRKYFEACKSELELMASKKYHGKFTYNSLIKKNTSLKRLALLTKNEEFLAKFEDDLKGFLNYREDLQEILNEAVQLKQQIEEVESRLEYIFGDFLPVIVIRKLAEFFTVEDLPQIDFKDLVQGLTLQDLPLEQ